LFFLSTPGTIADVAIDRRALRRRSSAVPITNPVHPSMRRSPGRRSLVLPDALNKGVQDEQIAYDTNTQRKVSRHVACGVIARDSP
jgi:hypothetical protein